MCDRLRKIVDILWLVFWLLCFLVPVRALEITESELEWLETLQKTQLLQLEESKAALNQSEQLRMQSETKYETALQNLKAAERLSALQQQQIETLREESQKQSTLAKKWAQSCSKYEIEAALKEAVLSNRIKQKNKIIGILASFTTAVCLFVLIKIVFKIRKVII